MADELTRNYGTLVPKSIDTMNQQVTPQTPGLVQNLRDAFEKWEKASNPDIISGTVLPQSGSYNVGDRVYCSNTTYRSSFILLSKVPAWGYIWRPVQCGIAPWIEVPAGAISGDDSAGWSQHPTSKLAFTLDNKGNCYWRGAIRKSTVGLPLDASQFIFANLPNGLRHHSSGMFTLAIDPATPQTDTGISAYKGGRIYIDATGYNTLRFHNSSTARDVYFDGIEYPCSLSHYYSP